MRYIIQDFDDSYVNSHLRLFSLQKEKAAPPSPPFKARCVKAIHFKQFVSHSASLKPVDKRLMSPCKEEEEEVKDERMERGRAGRKDEGKPRCAASPQEITGLRVSFQR